MATPDILQERMTDLHARNQAIVAEARNAGRNLSPDEHQGS